MSLSSPPPFFFFVKQHTRPATIPNEKNSKRSRKGHAFLLLIVGSLPIPNRVYFIPHEISDLKYLTYESPAGITKFHTVHGWLQASNWIHPHIQG